MYTARCSRFHAVMRAARRKSFPLLAVLLLQQILWVGPSFLASGSVSRHNQPNHSRIKLAPERAWTGLAHSRLHGRQSFDAGAETGKTLHVAAACCLVGTLASLWQKPTRCTVRLASLCVLLGALPNVLATEEEQNIRSLLR